MRLLVAGLMTSLAVVDLPTIGPADNQVPHKLHVYGAFAVVPTHGPVQINWQNAEAYVADPDSADPARGVARLLVAVRDGTWIPLNADPVH